MTLEIYPHDEWSAVSNAATQEEFSLEKHELEERNEGWIANFFDINGFSTIKLCAFEETPKLSTYLWTLNVGHYIVRSCDNYKLPIRFLTRRG